MSKIITTTVALVVLVLGLAAMVAAPAFARRIDDGAVQQPNFYDYTVMRMSDVPEIYVELIASDEHRSGVGAVAEKLEDFPRTLLVVENLCLRQHLMGLQRRHPQPRLRKADRQFRIPASSPVGAIRFWS
jgi:hypothetical protein